MHNSSNMRLWTFRVMRDPTHAWFAEANGRHESCVKGRVFVHSEHAALTSSQFLVSKSFQILPSPPKSIQPRFEVERSALQGYEPPWHASPFPADCLKPQTHTIDTINTAELI